MKGHICIIIPFFSYCVLVARRGKYVNCSLLLFLSLLLLLLSAILFECNLNSICNHSQLLLLLLLLLQSMKRRWRVLVYTIV